MLKHTIHATFPPTLNVCRTNARLVRLRFYNNPASSYNLPPARATFAQLHGRLNRRYKRMSPKLNGCSYVEEFGSTTHSPTSKVKMSTAAASSTAHRCFVGIGSNMGDRMQNIEEACNLLSTQNDIQLVRTSGLWQTKAMYVEDQNDFLNGVLEINTTLEPHQLLDALQGVENALGRKRVVEKGPRTLDLDILLYDNERLHTDRLIVPHPLMLEREFVLQPLCELIPHEAPPSSAGQDFALYLKQLPKADNFMSTQVRLAKFGPSLTPLTPLRQTRIMSIINVTPDSFSDGGIHSASNPDSLQQTIRSHIKSGATIIDVGGESTRPDAESIGDKEEKARVIPAIKLIKSVSSETDSHANVSISIDTYHASVARAAIEAGAHIINDVSGGTLDSEMLQTVAELGCPVILMHMRGNPRNMLSKENLSYPNGVIESVGTELLARVHAAEAAGVRRWKIILDPGIGFAKNEVQSLEVLRRFNELKNFPGLEGFPWLIGASRKRFIGRITGVQPAKERTWGTAVTVAASIQGGADIVRVHDVEEMQKVVLMADAIWRSKN